MRRPLESLAACAVAWMIPMGLSGQLHYGADLAFHTRYEWRGIRLHDGAVIQPDLFVGFGDELRITGGLFTSFELSSVGAGDIGFGADGLRPDELDVWIEAGVPLGGFDLGLGWIYRSFDTDGAVGIPAMLGDTHELFGRVRLLSLPVIVPEVRAFYDVDRVKGAFLEASLGIRIPFWPQVALPVGSLFLTPRVGFNLSQDIDPAAGEPGYYGDTGVAYWGFGLSLPGGSFGLGPFELFVDPTVHWEWKIDEMTKVVEDGRRRHREFWFSLTASISGPRCRPEKRLCPGIL